MSEHAIIIPYRDRSEHLPILLNALIKYRSLVDIYIFEQNNNNLFNRGQLFNSIINIKKDYKYYIFHDVDLIPSSDIDYIRDYLVPTHLSCYVEQFDYKLLDDVTDYKLSNMFGGVVALSKEHFLKVNGYSNLYEGWGCEDNDLLRRIKSKGLTIDRLPWSYKSLNHSRINNMNNNLLNNTNIYDMTCTSWHYRDKCLMASEMELLKKYDNVEHYLVNVGTQEIKCIIINDQTLLPNDLTICLLAIYQMGYSVILSQYHIDHIAHIYYGSYKHSTVIQDNVKFIHYRDLLLYILNNKITYKTATILEKKVDIYDYENHKFIKQCLKIPQIDTNTVAYNYFIYKLVNPDLDNKDRFELFDHYREQGINENRSMTFDLPPDFNIFTYYEYNKDLRYMKIFNRDKSTSCVALANHYMRQGINENRIINNETHLTIQNIDWLYFTYNINCNYVLKYYDFVTNYVKKIPLINFPFPTTVNTGSSRTLIITHPGGGGVEKYIKSLCRWFPNNIILRPNSVNHSLYECDKQFFHESNILQLYEYICSHKINLIIVNHMSIYTPQMFQMFSKIKSNYNCKSIVILHDITYLNNHVKTTYNLTRTKCMNDANLIIAPSKFIQNFYKCGTLMPHPDMTCHTIHCKARLDNDDLKILVIGDNKGSHNIRRYLKDNIKNKVIYLGKTDIVSDGLCNLGSYKDDELLSIILQINPHLIWFPGKVKEAYCYALSYAMLSGYPIVASKTGAFIERLCNRPLSWLIQKPLSHVIDYILSTFTDCTFTDNGPYISDESYSQVLQNYCT